MSEDRTALLSGASRGIGAAIAQRLSAAGWHLSLGLRRPVLPHGVDLARTHLVAYDALEGGEDAWAQAARDEFGRVDAVIACAGIMRPESVVEIDEVELDEMWAVNVRAPRRLIAAVWPDLRAAARGRVVVIASLSGQRVRNARSAPYAMTKHAAVALVPGVRQAGHADGIRATAVCPGFVATDMTRGVADVPADRMTQPEDEATLVQLALDVPNTASLAEPNVSCTMEDRF